MSIDDFIISVFCLVENESSRFMASEFPILEKIIGSYSMHKIEYSLGKWASAI